jgi:hypothetical protein
MMQFLMVTFAALMVRVPSIILPSITVPAVVIVVGPVYDVRAVPAGTPAVVASGKPVGIDVVAMHHPPHAHIRGRIYGQLILL